MFDKKQKYPIHISGTPLTSLIFLKHFITKAHIQVGDYSYYHDHNGEVAQVENTKALYDDPNPNAPPQLIIGKICQIASDATFICPYGQHHTNAFTTFSLFWKDGVSPDAIPDDRHFNRKGCTTVGHGAIIASTMLVTKDVPPYTIVGGSPAVVIRPLFSAKITAALLTLNWWNWPIETIEANYEALLNQDLPQLQQVANLFNASC